MPLLLIVRSRALVVVVVVGVCGFPRVVFLDGFVDFLRCGCSVSVVGFLGIIDLVGE
jgi:hypothetical protein